MIVANNYIYKVESFRVIDGDTVDVVMDLGCHVSINRRLRLLDLDTDELRGGTAETKQKAREAKARIQEILESGEVFVETKMDGTGKYGRLLAYLYVVNEYGLVSVNDQMVLEGYQKNS